MKQFDLDNNGVFYFVQSDLGTQLNHIFSISASNPVLTQLNTFPLYGNNVGGVAIDKQDYTLYAGPSYRILRFNSSNYNVTTDVIVSGLG